MVSKEGGGNDEQGVLNLCKNIVKCGKLKLSDIREQKSRKL